MAERPDEVDEESFELALDESAGSSYLRDVAKAQAITANLITVLLVGGVLLALVLYTVTAWWFPENVGKLDGFYEKWFSFVSPIVGTAVGFYFGTSRERRS